jgi:tetratricopeptide (TPR) repeat protein
MLLELGRHEQALAQQEVAVETLAKAAATPATAKALGAALARRGDMRLAARRDLAGASADYRKARSMLVELLATDAARTDVKRDLSLAHERVGDAALQSGDVVAAAEAFAACLTLRRELVARDGSNAEWRRDLSVALERSGHVESLRGRHQAAALALSEALELRKAVLEAKPDDLVAQRDLAILWLQLGNARSNAHARSSEIEQAYAQAIRLLRPLVERSDAESRWRRDLAVAYAERGEARRKAGDLAASRSDMQAALDLIRELRRVAPEDDQLVKDEGWLRARLAP